MSNDIECSTVKYSVSAVSRSPQAKHGKAPRYIYGCVKLGFGFNKNVFSSEATL